MMRLSQQGHRTMNRAVLASGVGTRAIVNPLSPERRTAFSCEYAMKPEEHFRGSFNRLAAPSNTGECWRWTGRIDPNGYGIFYGGQGRTSRAHRWAWMLYRGPIPKDLVLDHICRVRECVNPDHLRLVTVGQNSTENSVGPTAQNKAATHCVHGHPFDGDNLAYAPTGWRRCRACSARRSSAFRGRRRAKLASAPPSQQETDR